MATAKFVPCLVWRRTAAPRLVADAQTAESTCSGQNKGQTSEPTHDVTTVSSGTTLCWLTDRSLRAMNESSALSLPSFLLTTSLSQLKARGGSTLFLIVTEPRLERDGAAACGSGHGGARESPDVGCVLRPRRVRGPAAQSPGRAPAPPAAGLERRPEWLRRRPGLGRVPERRGLRGRRVDAPAQVRCPCRARRPCCSGVRRATS